MSELVARRCLVAGRVQGVYYRASTRSRARELGVTGHARNLRDGRVEILACGPAAAVDELCRWLWQGSPSSQVATVEVTELSISELGALPDAFRTG